MVKTKHTPKLNDLPRARVVVVGDIITDHWIYGRVERISPEAPVPVFLQERVELSDGGAGNVAANLAALGCNDTGDRLFGLRTSIKRRFIAGNHQQMFRHDIEKGEALSRLGEDIIFSQATTSTSIGCLVLSDYGKGTLTPGLCQKLIRWARQRKIPVVVDPKGEDWSKYDGATVITPNEAEYDHAIRPRMWSYDLVVTLGARGMRLEIGSDKPIEIPAQAREVFDVVGAGDTVVAVLAACLAVGFGMTEAARVANKAAGVVVGKRGTATCSLEELKND